jgi:SopE GEF domain
MSISIAASNRVAPPASADVSSAAQPIGRMATAVKNCTNVPVQLPQAEKTHGMFCKSMHFLGFKSGENASKTTSLDTVDGPSTEAASAGQSKGRMASGLKRSANVSERPTYIERRHQHGVLCKVMHALGLKSNEVSNKTPVIEPMMQRSEPLTEAKRQEIRGAIQEEIKKFNFEGTLKADPVFMNQAFQIMYGAVFGRAQDSVTRNCAELKVSLSEKKECSVELGSIAKEFGMDGQEKNGVFAPACIGASGFATMILTPIQKSYNAAYNDNRSELTLYTEALVAEKLRSIALDQGRPDPKEFSLRLQNVLIEHFPDYD